MAQGPRSTWRHFTSNREVLASKDVVKTRSGKISQTQLAKLAKEECEQLLAAVSSVYTPAELETLEKDQAAEHEPERTEPLSPNHLPPAPAADAPLEAFERPRMQEGLAGVLDEGRGKIDGWLENLRTRQRMEKLKELHEWFQNFREREPQEAEFLKKFDDQIEQGGLLCQRSQIFVRKLEEEGSHKRHHVEDFVDKKLRGLTGNGDGAIVNNVEAKRLAAHNHFIVSRAAAEEAQQIFEEKEEALANVKREFYEQRIEKMKLQQAEQDKLTELQAEIEKRHGDLADIRAQANEQGQKSESLQAFVRLAHKALADGRQIEAKDPELQMHVQRGREYALSRKRFVRNHVCTNVDLREREAKEHTAAARILEDWAADANAEAVSKENVIDALGGGAAQSRRPSEMQTDVPAPTEEELKTQQLVKAEMVNTMKVLRTQRGRIDQVMRSRQAIADAVAHCERVQTEVRSQIKRSLPKFHQEAAEEEGKLHTEAGQRLPSSWYRHLQREWHEVKPFAEMAAMLLFKTSFAEPKQKSNADSPGKRRNRQTSAQGHVDSANAILADAEATLVHLQELENNLTPSRMMPEEAERLEQAGKPPSLDDSWWEEELLAQRRHQDLRAMQKEMLKQVRQVADNLTPDACLLEALNMAEILRAKRGDKAMVRTPGGRRRAAGEA